MGVYIFILIAVKCVHNLYSFNYRHDAFSENAVKRQFLRKSHSAKAKQGSGDWKVGIPSLRILRILVIGAISLTRGREIYYTLSSETWYF